MTEGMVLVEAEVYQREATAKEIWEICTMKLKAN